MSSFRISLANITVEIYPTNVGVATFFKEYLSDAEPMFSVRTSHQEIEITKQRLALEDKKYGRLFIDYSFEYVEKQTVLGKVLDRLPEYGATMIHGSALSHAGSGYIFIGPSGVGKSTHTRLWRECFADSVQMINDDKPVIALRKDSCHLFGSPWQGKHNIGANISAPLKGIVVLQQGKENAVRRLSQQEALPHLLQQIYKPSSSVAVESTLNLIDCILHSVEVYLLSCKPDKEAVSLIHHCLK